MLILSAVLCRGAGFQTTFEPQGSHFIARSATGFLSLHPAQVTFRNQNSSVTMRLVKGNPKARRQAFSPVGASSNYLLGNNPRSWRTGVPHYRSFKYKNVYPGIDVHYYSTEGNLEYDFVLAPGADSDAIELAWDGVDRIRTDTEGGLLLPSKGSEIRHRRPLVYQWVNGQRHFISCSYRINGNRVKFALGDYDKNRQLVIDPVIQSSAYFGGTGYDAAVPVAVDATGATYIAGITNSVELPTTNGSAQRDNAGASDAFVAKFSPSGSLAWVTYFGGKGTEGALGLALDAASNVYVSGFTTSADLPVREAVQPNFGGGELDAFIVKLSPGGNQIVYSTYIGGAGEDYGNSVAADGAGNAYLTGWTRSANFPVRGGFQQGASGGGGDTFVTKLTPTGTLGYSTYVGGNGDDLASGIAVDAAGSAYVTGGTTSTVFPLASPVQRTNSGKYDVFVYKLNPAGNSLIYSTLLGGVDDDSAQRIAVDGNGSAYVSGYTRSSDFPLRNAAAPARRGGADAFVFKLAPAGDSLAYSTLLAGSADDWAYGLAVDSGGSAYVSGWTNSLDFPVRNAAQATFGGGLNDGFAARLSPTGDAILYSTYLGGKGEDKAYGLALERSGAVQVTGHTDSLDLPSAANTLAQGLKTADAFLVKLSPDTSSAYIAASPGSLAFEWKVGSAVPSPASVAISSTGAVIGFTAGASGRWLRVTPDRGLTGSGLTVSIAPEGLTPGIYREEITVNAPSASNTAALRIAVTLTVTADPPKLTAGGIVNAATFAPGPIAPGEIIAVFGSGFGGSADAAAVDGALPTALADTRLSIDGVPVPLLYVRPSQLSGIVPYSLAGKTSAEVYVEVNGRRSEPVTAALAPSAPGLFNTTLALRSVTPGSIIVLYATGEGRPPVTDVSVRVAGLLAEVLYAGPIPGAIAGVMQLNIRIPSDTPVGKVPVVLSVGGASSPVLSLNVSPP